MQEAEAVLSLILLTKLAAAKMYLSTDTNTIHQQVSKMLCNYWV